MPTEPTSRRRSTAKGGDDEAKQDEVVPENLLPVYRRKGLDMEVAAMVPAAEAVTDGSFSMAGMVITPIEQTSVHVLMGRILAELPAIGKDQVNRDQGFNFRGIDDVLNALNPLLAKYGVFYVPQVLERIADKRTTGRGSTMYEVNLHVQYTFYGPRGDSVVASSWGEGTDMGDKSTNKAMTGAMKQTLFQAFAIATQEVSEQESDRTSPEETIDPNLLAQQRGWADHATFLGAHEQLTERVKKAVEAGLLTEANRAALKELGYGWPMDKTDYDEYVATCTQFVEANQAAKRAEASQEEGDGSTATDEPSKVGE